MTIILVASYAWLFTSKLETWEWFGIVAVTASIAGAGPILQRFGAGRSLGGVIMALGSSIMHKGPP